MTRSDDPNLDWVSGTCDWCGCTTIVATWQEDNGATFDRLHCCTPCLDEDPAPAPAPAHTPQERMFQFPTSMRGQLNL